MSQWVKNPQANAGGTEDASSIPGSGRCPGEGDGNLFQHSCLGNATDRGARRAERHVVLVGGEKSCYFSPFFSLCPTV